MPRRKIKLSIGDYYHVYNRAVAGNLLFKEDRNYRFFISRIKKYLLKTADVVAFCLMPNHYHLIIQLKEINLPSSMQRLGMSYTGAFNKVYGRSGHLFQGRYQLRLIDTSEYLAQAVDYIHHNPCRAGLVVKPEQWEMSSYLEYFGRRPVDFIKPDIVLEFCGVDHKPGPQITPVYR